MADVEIEILGRRHMVGCEAGQEARLRAVAKNLDVEARALGAAGGLSESRLYLMLALTSADALVDARSKIQSLEAGLASGDPDAAERLAQDETLEAARAEMAQTLDEAADRLERLAEELRGGTV